MSGLLSITILYPATITKVFRAVIPRATATAGAGDRRGTAGAVIHRGIVPDGPYLWGGAIRGTVIGTTRGTGPHGRGVLLGITLGTVLGIIRGTIRGIIRGTTRGGVGIILGSVTATTVA